VPDGWTQPEKADTAPAWAIPVLQINKGVHFLALSDYCCFLTLDSLKIHSAREGKYTAKQDLCTCLYANLVAWICEFSE